MMPSSILSDKSILYAEDEVSVATEVARVLRDIGFRDLRMAHSLRVADQLVGRSLPDIALLDVNLGYGELSVDLGLRLSAQDVRVIFMSGYSRDELGHELHRFEFLEKPFGEREILSVFWPDRTATARIETA